MRIRHIKGAEEALKKDRLVVQGSESLRGRWCKNIFKRDAPLYLEIGSGMGLFLRVLSLVRPWDNFIGLEMNATVLFKSLKRYRQSLTQPPSGTLSTSAGLLPPLADNLRFIWSNAFLLDNFFEKEELSGIFLNFPDPWPKEKNVGRRLTNPHFLNIYREILDKNGTLEFKTDNEKLFDYSLKSLEGCDFSILFKTRDLYHDGDLLKGNVMTEYESKFVALGNRIFKLQAAVRQN